MKYFFFLVGCFFMLSCSNQNDTNNTESEAVEMEKPTFDKSFESLFEEIIVVKMHLFSSLDQSLPDYPYVGKKLSEKHFNYLSEELLENPGWGIYATYKVQDDMYILRVPSKEFSNELVLCSIDTETGKLVKNQVLANAWCNGRCHQQDGWLADLDLDQHLELIIRGKDTNAEGKVVGSVYKVMTQNGDGNFQIGKEAIASAPTYVLQEGVIPSTK